MLQQIENPNGFLFMSISLALLSSRPQPWKRLVSLAKIAGNALGFLTWTSRVS
jgi:hypothetical protein